MAVFGLVHGAWHGAWCWERLTPELELRGHGAIAVDLPAEDSSAGLSEYAAHVVDALTDADERVVVVGHSLGAATIPLVARRRHVDVLVFLCAVLPLPGGSVADRYRAEPELFAPGFTGNTSSREDGASFWPDLAAARRCFFHDCADEDAAWALARLRAQAQAPSHEPWPPDPLPDVERHAVVARDDRAVSADWWRRTAREQLEVEPLELDGGHSPFVSRPDELAELLCRVA